MNFYVKLQCQTSALGFGNFAESFMLHMSLYIPMVAVMFDWCYHQLPESLFWAAGFGSTRSSVTH